MHWRRKKHVRNNTKKYPERAVLTRWFAKPSYFTSSGQRQSPVRKQLYPCSVRTSYFPRKKKSWKTLACTTRLHLVKSRDRKQRYRSRRLFKTRACAVRRDSETPKSGLASVATEPAELLMPVGGDILSLVTSGMYTTPLSIYREYIQNAADSIAAFNNMKNGKVEISLHLDSMSLSIRDNGPGLSRTQAIKELLPIAMSNKSRQTDRGFRGIGRLSGLAFGEFVTFLTRCNETDPVTRVVWNGSNLRRAIDNGLSIEKAISDCVAVDTVEGNDYPPHFFEVQLGGISRYAAASILNRVLVREYIGEICPVPFSKDFPYVARVSSLFKRGQEPFELKVLIDGEGFPCNETVR